MPTALTTRLAVCATILLIAAAQFPAIRAQAQDADEQAAQLRAGKNFIPTSVFTLEEDREVLKLFEGLRVADVSDGMDSVGLQNVGLVSPEIRPLWRDTKHFTHRTVGVAVTARYVPTNLPKKGTGPISRAPTEGRSGPKAGTDAQRWSSQKLDLSPFSFDKWVGHWYKEYSGEPFVPLLRAGTVLVIEDAESVDVGSIGSNNILGWKARGCVGVVTGATARDTDEIAAQGVPLYFKHPGRGIRPGRNEIESVNRPVVVGGVVVMPGDVIVADGDGVIVVPRRAAREVAEYARKILEGDKAGRRAKYEQLGLPLDDSVK